jgi:hypothetical protein
MTVYVLIYDVDHGSREDCNIFYSPIEVFSTAAARQARIQKLTDLNEDIGWREEDLELHDNADFEISEHYHPYEDEEDDDVADDDDEDEDEDNDEFAEGSEALTLLEELAEEVSEKEQDTGVDFSDDFMNLSLDDFLDALATKIESDEKEKESLIVKEKELTPQDCYYYAEKIENPWGGEEEAVAVWVIPQDKFDGIAAEFVELPYGMVPVVMTEQSVAGGYYHRGTVEEARQIMNRYGFFEVPQLGKFCPKSE